MKHHIKYILPVIIAFLAILPLAHAQVSPPNYIRKLGTNVYVFPNTASTTLGTSTEDVAAKNLVIYGTCTGCLAGGSGTSTINQVKGPTFTFSVVNTSSPSSITTSSASVFLNLLQYTSSSQITVSATGTLIFASKNVSQFTNDSNYLVVNGTSSSFIANDTKGLTFPMPSYLAANGCPFNAADTDAGVCMNDYIAAAASNGGTITVPASSTGYSYSTGIVNGTNGQYVLINCAGGNSTKFSFTGTGTTTAITLDAGDTLFANWGVTGCWFDGNNVSTSTVGLQLGKIGGNGASFAKLTGTRFTHFGTNGQTGDNTFLVNLSDAIFAGAVTNNFIYAGTSNVGENDLVDHADIFYGNTATMAQINNCLQTTKGFSTIAFRNPSIDNCAVVSSGSGLGLLMFINIHAEDPIADNASSSYVPLENRAPGVIYNIEGGLILNDASSNTPTAFVSSTGPVVVNGLTIQANSSGTATAAFQINGNGSIHAINVINATSSNGNFAFKTLVAGSGPNIVTSPNLLTPFLAESAPGQPPFEAGETVNGDTIFYDGTTGSAVGSLSLAGGWNFGSGTTSTFKVRVAGRISLLSSSTVTSASIGGSQLSPGQCASATTAIDPNIVSSTASFTPPTPKIDPGPSFYYKADWVSAGNISIRVCAVTTSTPGATTYVTKIIE